MKAATLCRLAACAILLAACGKKPRVEFAPFRSAFSDFECLAPKSWAVENADQGDSYRFTIWVGPEDPQALWGAPRFVAAWHANGKSYRKASGEAGKYDSVDDYLRQTTATVWSPDPQYPEPRKAITVDGRPAERLAVRFEKDAYMSLPGAKPGTVGGGRVWRKDTAVFVPTRTGFYTFVFPATEASSKVYGPAFERLIESLRFLKESPVE